MTRDFKGVWIPKDIWLSDDLTLQEKAFLAEIDSLDNEEGCFASNQYFADFFGVSKTRASLVIKSLIDKGYITSLLIYKEGTQEILKRVIKVSYIGYLRKVKEGIQGNLNTPPLEKLKDNNTTINNTVNNTSNNTNNIVPYEDIKCAFNEICTSLSKVITLSNTRKDKLKTRWGEIKDLETFEIIFNKVQSSSFLKGGNKSGWKCTFDWLIDNSNNYVKVLEGQYDNKADKDKEDMQDLLKWAEQEDMANE